jgi:hypothetical protein
MSAEPPFLGVDKGDTRYANILAAAEGPGSLPSLPSPFTGRTYPYRIIDLELCRKINVADWKLAGRQKDWIGRIVNNIPYGVISDPSD